MALPPPGHYSPSYVDFFQLQKSWRKSRRLATDILLGHDLRAAFPGGDTLAQSPVSGAGIALINAHSGTTARYTKLRRTVELGYGAKTRMSSLPALLTEALRLVDELAH